MSEYDPRLVAPACLYLAAKAEESTVQAKALVFYIRKISKDVVLNQVLWLSNFQQEDGRSNRSSNVITAKSPLLMLSRF